jgi:hypothetical protein
MLVHDAPGGAAVSFLTLCLVFTSALSVVVASVAVADGRRRS